MMHLVIAAIPEGPFAVAAEIAISKGATVSHASCGEQVMAVLRSGRVVNLIMVEVGIDICDIARQLAAEHFHIPIVACGVRNNVRTAVAAIHTGAKEYISLIPDPEIIAVMLIAVAEGTSDLIDRDEAVALVVEVAGQVKPSGVLVKRSIADVERDLILETLRDCLGNRTHAARILGISVRTLRNKLRDYIANGISVPAPSGGELRGFA